MKCYGCAGDSAPVTLAWIEPDGKSAKGAHFCGGCSTAEGGAIPARRPEITPALQPFTQEVLLRLGKGATWASVPVPEALWPPPPAPPAPPADAAAPADASAPA